jgi:hypothetical protein
MHNRDTKVLQRFSDNASVIDCQVVLVCCAHLSPGGADTLDAYIDKYSSLVSYLADNATGTPVSDSVPPEQISKAISLQVSSQPHLQT